LLLQEQGEDLLGRTIAMNEKMRAKLREIPGVEIADFEGCGFEYDKSKTVVKLNGIGGYDLRLLLGSEFGIGIEKGTMHSILLMSYPSITDLDIDTLVAAIAKISLRVTDGDG